MRHTRRAYEEPANHESWAIPYGDLVTLLLAFFVVLYATSSINEGKYRVLSDAMAQAFGSSPRAATPMVPTATHAPLLRPKPDGLSAPAPGEALSRIADDIEKVLAPLLKKNLVAVRRHAGVIEIEISSDILFSSGSAEPSPVALHAVQLVSEVLYSLNNPIRIEGHTDDQPIRTAQFPSNWELSAARAARVVREFVAAGIDPTRFAIIGYGQYRPVASNVSEADRNANRRVVLSVFSDKKTAAAALPLDDEMKAHSPPPVSP